MARHTRHALVNINGPQRAMTGRASNAQPKLMLAGARHIVLAAADEQPLPRELREARPRQIIKLGRLMVLLTLRGLLGVMRDDESGTVAMTDFIHGTQQSALGLDVIGVRAGHTKIRGVDDDHFALPLLDHSLHFVQVLAIVEPRQELREVQVLDARKLNTLGVTDSTCRFLQRRHARLTRKHDNLARPLHGEAPKERLGSGQRKGKINDKTRLQRLLRPAQDARLLGDQNVLNQILQVEGVAVKLLAGNELDERFLRFCFGLCNRRCIHQSIRC